MDLQSEHFVCRRCGACCRAPGIVRLTDGDVDALAAALGLSPEAFVAEYAELAPGRSGLRLRGAPEAPCEFLAEDGLCRVHAARPRQCREFPARWKRDDLDSVCLGMRSAQ